METPVAFTLILATLIFASDPVHSDRIYASKNPLPVGSNVTLFSQFNITTGVWLFKNQIIVLILPGSNIINEAWKGRIQVTTANSSLTIESVQLSDSGEYTLDAVNSFRASVTLSVQEYISNVTLKVKETNLIEFNDTAVFTCSVSSGTSLSYSWLMGSSVISAGGNVHLSDGNTTLTITNVTRYDAGPFMCSVSNGISNDISSSVYLNISFGPSNTSMKIMPMVSGYIYRTGSDITLSCSASSMPAAMIKWMFNGVNLNKYGPWIQLENATESNSGTYTCVFHNIVTSRFSSTSMNIWILDPIEEVKVKDIGGPVILHKSFTLYCEVNGSVDRIQWWKNNGPISMYNTTFGMNNKTVTFNSVQFSDNGNYTCQAFNSVSNMTSSPYKVDVKYGPKMPTIMGPSLAKTGYNVTFSCYASSNPPSHYRWYFNYSVVANTSEYVTPPLTQSMSGMYVCEALNYITGQNKTAYKMLTVVDPIKYVKVEAEMGSPKEGHSYMLTCNVTGPVDHVYWMKNGIKLHKENGTDYYMDGDTITFNMLTRNDTGYYTCMAKNAVGNMTSHPYKLLVNFGPEMPIIDGPMYAETGHCATFTCSAESVPPSTFTWWFNNTEVANNSVFTIGPLTLNMSGEYTCKAYNYVTGNSSMDSQFLTVIEAIESVVIKNDSVPINGENFTLTCEVMGPYDMIYWMKDNKQLSMNGSYMDYYIENDMLHFNPVTRKNDGMYSCVATNKVAHHQSLKYMLWVNYGPLSVSITGPDSVKPDLSVSLTCSADSRPESEFYWYFNTMSSEVIHTGFVFTFVATKEREGKYICEARNPVTNITMYHYKTLTVSSLASAIHFPSQGSLMLMGVFALFVPALFN